MDVTDRMKINRFRMLVEPPVLDMPRRLLARDRDTNTPLSHASPCVDEAEARNSVVLKTLYI